MKKLKKLGYIVLFASLVTLDSCLPVDDVVADLTPALTSGTWNFKEVDENDTFVKEFYEGLYTGRSITFSSSGTFTQNLAIYNQSGNWEFNDAQTILHYDVGTSEAEDWEILNLTNSELYYQVDFSGTVVKIRYTH